MIDGADMNILNLLLFRPDVFLSLLCINVVVVVVDDVVVAAAVAVTTNTVKYSQNYLLDLSLKQSWNLLREMDLFVGLS